MIQFRGAKQRSTLQMKGWWSSRRDEVMWGWAMGRLDQLKGINVERAASWPILSTFNPFIQRQGYLFVWGLEWELWCHGENRRKSCFLLLWEMGFLYSGALFLEMEWKTTALLLSHFVAHIKNHLFKNTISYSFPFFLKAVIDSYWFVMWLIDRRGGFKMFKASSTVASFEYLIQLVWLILHSFCTGSFKDLQSI